MMTNKPVAEFIGTFWLVLAGCGAAVLAAGVPSVGIGRIGVSLPLGQSVLLSTAVIDRGERVMHGKRCPTPADEYTNPNGRNTLQAF